MIPMEIPVDLFEKWKVLRSPGDVKELIKLLEGSNYQSFNRAFRDGKCSDSVFDTMNTFYEKKAEKLKSVLNKKSISKS